jgi:hypothetical protein
VEHERPTEDKTYLFLHFSWKLRFVALVEVLGVDETSRKPSSSPRRVQALLATLEGNFKPHQQPKERPLPEYRPQQPKIVENTHHKTAADVDQAMSTFRQEQEPKPTMQPSLDNGAHAAPNIEGSATASPCSGVVSMAMRKSDSDIDDTRPHKRVPTKAPDRKEYLAIIYFHSKMAQGMKIEHAAVCSGMHVRKAKELARGQSSG